MADRAEELENIKQVAEIVGDIKLIKEGLNTANTTLAKLTNTTEGLRVTLNATNEKVIRHEVVLESHQRESESYRKRVEDELRIYSKEIEDLKRIVERGKGASWIIDKLVPGGVGAAIVVIANLVRDKM